MSGFARSRGRREMLESDEYIKEEAPQAKNEKETKGKKERSSRHQSVYDLLESKRKTMKVQPMTDRPDWEPIKTFGATAPSEMFVTHINQNKDVVRAGAMETIHAEGQSSTEWLKTHSIETLKLTIEDLVNKGTVGQPQPNKENGKVQQQLHFDSTTINEFEYKLNMAIETYTRRIKWLLQGSKKVFGMVKGTRVAVLVDVSDANCGFGRLTNFQEALVHLLDEQISQKQKLYMMSFGTDIDPLWKDVRDNNIRIMNEAKDWVSRLTPSGGCNLLKALKHVMKLKHIDSVCVVLGSVPDQSSDILSDYVSEVVVGRELPLHTVAYDCSNHLTNITLRNMADESNGRYHCYTATCEEQIYTGSDISLLLAEIQKAQDAINKIKEMRQGMLGSALVSVMNEISSDVSKLPQSRFLPRPPGHDHPLRLEMPTFQPSTTLDWLKKHGLKAKGLDLYQVLAPNAYSYKEEFIPVIRRTVQSQVHEKAMAQFQWHDGSMRNVHVDMAMLFEYQKQLGATVSLLEKRIDWLSTASKKLFGTITEKNLVLMLDLSVSNVNYLVHIQHSLRLLLQEQMANKEYFNIVAFHGDVSKWKPTLMKPTPENLQSAWRWVLELECIGSRNFMGAVHAVVENDEEAKHGIEVEGIYLFTSGIPDQPMEVACAYLEEACAGRNLKLHTTLFNVDDYDANGAIPGRYANITSTAEVLRGLAHCTHGRFHWIRETGIIESDDISCLTTEIDKAINFSKKCAMLVESVKKKYDKPIPQIVNGEDVESVGSSEPPRMKILPPPKPTALTMARLQISEGREKEEPVPKALSWRPSSARSRGTISINNGVTYRPQSAKTSHRPTSAKDPMQVVTKNGKKTAKAFFYTDHRNGVGSVYHKYPEKKSVRKGVKGACIPEKEEQLTSREWMRLYSLNRMKLDLNKIVAGPDCKHSDSPVKTLNRRVEAKYCHIFPSINVNGTVKHLQLLPHELKTYETQLEKILKRYIKRLQWLLSGSRRVFGTVIEKKVVILIDTSGSMEQFMEELRKELASLIWEQLHVHKIHFNLVRFSKECETWRNEIMAPTEENCHDAVRWISGFTASGNTCTLEALDRAFEHGDLEAVYLLTDGKPDNSTSMVLREVAQMNSDRQVAVNTISFNCMDSTANNFLKLLAQQTSGRYHRIHSDFDAHKFAHKLLTEGFNDHQHPHLPDFEGDDLRRLGSEIALARRYLTQARAYRDMYNEKNNSTVTTGDSDERDSGIVSTRNYSSPRLNRPKSAFR